MLNHIPLVHAQTKKCHIYIYIYIYVQGVFLFITELRRKRKSYTNAICAGELCGRADTVFRAECGSVTTS